MFYKPKQQYLPQYSEEFPTVYGHGHDIIMQNIVDSLTLKTPPLISLDDGLKTIQLLHAIYKSDEQNGWVNVNELTDSARLGRMDDKLAGLYRTSSRNRESV
jgi:predicted dehydrogenase